MQNPTTSELSAFTLRFINQCGTLDVNPDLLALPSPCLLYQADDTPYWQPYIIDNPQSLIKVEQALDIIIRPEIHQFYTYQFAADMLAQFADINLSLIQVWNQDDFIRLQENLIGHLVTQRRLKINPSLFIATIDAELTIISVCNLTGNVILEDFGSHSRKILAQSLAQFISQLEVAIHRL